MRPDDVAVEALVAGLSTYLGDAAAGARREALYRRWVSRCLAGLTTGDQSATEWLRSLIPAARTLPAMILSSHRLLPECRPAEVLRAAYRPFELPYRLAEIHTAATRGSEPAVRAMEAIEDAYEAIIAAARTTSPGVAQIDELAQLVGSRQELDRWIRPGPDVDLAVLVGNRDRVQRVVRKYGWRLDWQTQMAVLTFVRDSIATYPDLATDIGELAAEGVRLALSGLAEPVVLGIQPKPALALAGGNRSNPFPTRLGQTADWQALRLWKYRPSPFAMGLQRRGDAEAADAVLRAGAQVVATTITVGPLDPRVRPVYGAVLRRWRQDLREDRPLDERLAEFPAPVSARVLASAEPAPRRAGATPDESRPPAYGAQPAPATSAEPQPDAVETALATLDTLVGMEAVKLQIRQIAALAKVNARRVAAGMPAIPVGYHMLLTGNPGTGKTTVARVIGELFGGLDVLTKGHVVEAAPADFIAQYVGGTEKKTRALLERAAGGVLFIDEAYNLTTEHPMDYGHDAIAVLVAEMENRRHDLVVLAAGYSHEMHQFLESNPGLRSRFSYTLPFPDLDDAALHAVFLGFTERDGFQLGEEATAAVARAIRGLPRGPGFGNARDVRKLYEQAVVRQAARVLDGGPEALLTMLAEDIPGGEPPGRASLEAVWAELDALVGLDEVKAEVRTLGNMARLARVRRERGLPGWEEPVGHMVFTGNPGTGKTTVARLMGRLLSAVGALPRSDVLVVTRGDLVGEYLGQTAPKTRKVFERALGGVLFIDEAYSLMSGSSGDQYGHEALATLLPLMEEHRKHVVVVMAGYTAEMEGLLNANPGLRSRISRSIEFPDYSPEEMAQIVRARVHERDLELTPEAEQAIRELMRRLPRGPTFGNARAAIGVLGQILERQANRLATIPSARLTDGLGRLEVADIPEPPAVEPVIGFV